MAFVLADRVQETTTTTGTGTITLAGAVSGFQGFSAVGDGNSTYYTISNTAAAEWEVGIGTYTASGTTLSRTTIISSSNGGSAVNFSAGTKNVFVTYPASRAVFANAASDVVLISSSTTKIATGTPSSSTDLVSIASNGQQSSVVPGGSTLYPEYKCRAWVNFDGTGTVAIRSSGNVTSITDNGTGDYTINFTTAMPDVNYAVSISAGAVATGFGVFAVISMTTSAVRFGQNRIDTSPTVRGDGALEFVSVFR